MLGMTPRRGIPINISRIHSDAIVEDSDESDVVLAVQAGCPYAK